MKLESRSGIDLPLRSCIKKKTKQTGLVGRLSTGQADPAFLSSPLIIRTKECVAVLIPQDQHLLNPQSKPRRVSGMPRTAKNVGENRFQLYWSKGLWIWEFVHVLNSCVYNLCNTYVMPLVFFIVCFFFLFSIFFFFLFCGFLSHPLITQGGSGRPSFR